MKIYNELNQYLATEFRMESNAMQGAEWKEAGQRYAVTPLRILAERRNGFDGLRKVAEKISCLLTLEKR